MFMKKVISAGLVAALGWFMATPSQAAETTLQTILKRGEIIVGMDIPYEPFEFIDDDGNFAGFEVDLAQELADQLGVKLKLKKAGSFDTIRTELNSGDFDLILSGMTRTLARAREVNFSAGYYSAGLIMMVNTTRAVGGSATSYGDFNSSDAIITVQSGTTGEGAALNFFTKAQVNPFPSTPLAVQEVIDGRVDAVVMDDANIIPTFIGLASPDLVLCCPIIDKASSSADVRARISMLSSEYYGMAVRFGEEELLHWLNLFIEQAQTTLVVTDELAKKYELKSDSLGQALLPALQAKWGL